MPKRKCSEVSDEYLLRKIKKLEKKLLNRSRRTSRSLSSEDLNPELSSQQDNQPEENSADLTMVDVDNNDPQNTTLMESGTQNTDLQFDQPSDIDLQISDHPSTFSTPPEPGIVLDESILELLGETPSKNKKFDPPIQAELGLRWEHITSTGLSKDAKKNLLERYHVPQNCQKIGAPILNPEIKAALSEILVKKDKAFESKQNQQALALSCIGQALTKIFANQYKDADTIRLLIDAGKLLCDSQYVESMCRRSFVTSTIRKDIKDHLYATEIDSHLFGEKLAETLKSAKAINKSGAEMKNILQTKRATFPQSKFAQARPLNSRPPLPLARQAAGAGRRPVPVVQQPRRYQAQPQPGASGQASSSQHPPPAQVPSSQRSRGRAQTRR